MTIKRKIGFVALIVSSSAVILFALWYMFALLVTIASFATSFILINDYGNPVTIDVLYYGRNITRGEERCYSSSADRCMYTVMSGGRLALFRTSEIFPHSLIIKSDEVSEARCFNQSLDSEEESDVDNLRNLLFLRGLDERESSLSQHPLAELDDNGHPLCGR
ncbi:hypothetical protein KBC55_04550 [Patescibacteria group bacterium]|nr:hypothetical protein [Patescibacteria group bacterium]